MLDPMTRQLLPWLTSRPQLIKTSELILVLVLTSMLAVGCAGPGLPIPSKPSTNSEPYPQECTGTRSFNGQLFSISLHASEAREDIRIQFQALQPNVTFLPS